MWEIFNLPQPMHTYTLSLKFSLVNVSTTSMYRYNPKKWEYYLYIIGSFNRNDDIVSIILVKKANYNLFKNSFILYDFPEQHSLHLLQFSDVSSIVDADIFSETLPEDEGKHWRYRHLQSTNAKHFLSFIFIITLSP